MLDHKLPLFECSQVSLLVQRSGGTFGVIRVNYSSNGTLPSPAIDGSDYSLTSNCKYSMPSQSTENLVFFWRVVGLVYV